MLRPFDRVRERGAVDPAQEDAQRSDKKRMIECKHKYSGPSSGGLNLLQNIQYHRTPHETISGSALP